VQSVTFNQGGQNLVTSYSYQDNAVPTMVDVTDPTGLVTRSEYDALGRLSKRIDNYKTTPCPVTECNLITRYEYDSVGNLKRIFDPHNIRTEYEYDPLHRLTGVIENYTGSGVYAGIVDENIKTRYDYDPEGNLTRVTNLPTGRFNSFTYDELNRPDLMNDGLNHLTDYAYDPISNPSQIVNPKSEIVNYTYDLLNRLTTIDYPNPEGNVTFSYDNLNRRTTMTDPTGQSRYTYDDLDRLTEYRQPGIGGPSSLVSYGYDSADRLTSVSPNWDSGSYSYSYLNQRLISMTRPSGLVTTYGYDSANRINAITHRPSISQSPISNYQYTLDQSGNVRTATESQATLLPAGTYQESGGQVVMEAETGQSLARATHTWLTATAQSGYTGTAYLQSSLDIDRLYQTTQITTSPRVEFMVNFTTLNTYTVWLRGYASNAAGDSAYVRLGNQTVGVTGLN
jgi:YD repeat-containing protein